MTPTTRREWRAEVRSSATVHVIRRVLTWLNPVRLRCLIVGHDDYLAREPHRLFLRCGECERSTRGWTIGPDVREIRRVEPARTSHELIAAIAHR
jgi:hypothetical protein